MCSFKYYLLYCLLFSSSFVFAQQLPARSQASPVSKIDSIKNLLQRHNTLDTFRVDLQNQLGYENWIVNPTESESYGLAAIELSKVLAYSKGEAMANRVVGVAHWVRGNYQLAFRYLFKAYEIYQSLEDRLGTANSLLNLGMVYQDQKNYDKAESHYGQALGMFQELGASSRVATTQTKWGSMLAIQAQYDAAYERLITALHTHEAENFQYGIAEANSKLGELFINKGELNTALSYLLQAVEAGAKRFDHVGIADNFQKIGAIYIQKKDYGQALNYLNRAKNMAESFNLKSIQKRIYFSLKNLYEQQGRLKEALTYYDKYASISDSLFNEEKANQIQRLQSQFEYSQQEKELEIAQQQLALMVAENRSNQLQKIAFILAFLLIGSIAWNLLRRKDRIIQKGEKALIVAETHQQELQEELQSKEKELTSYTLNFVQKNELFQAVKSSINDLKKEAGPTIRQRLSKLARLIDSTVRIDEDWETFRLHFESTHVGLIQSLKHHYPQLTQNDLRLLALVRINLSSKEIGGMLGISPESVKTARYRLRKKMGLATQESLFDFLVRMEKTGV